MAQKAVELILMRQLASYLAMPVFVVDVDGRLLWAGGTARCPTPSTSPPWRVRGGS